MLWFCSRCVYQIWLVLKSSFPPSPLQLLFASSATGFYFVYDFCLYGNMSALVSYTIRYLPLLVALLLCPVVVLLRWAFSEYTYCINNTIPHRPAVQYWTARFRQLNGACTSDCNSYFMTSNLAVTMFACIFDVGIAPEG